MKTAEAASDGRSIGTRTSLSLSDLTLLQCALMDSVTYALLSSCSLPSALASHDLPLMLLTCRFVAAGMSRLSLSASSVGVLLRPASVSKLSNMAAIHFTQRPEFEAYVYNAEHTVDVLVTLKADRSADDNGRAELCLSAALDTSGSMTRGKLSLVKRTMQFAVRQLSENDKLGLVSYQTDVEEALTMKEMTEEGKRDAQDSVERLRAQGSTNLSGGLFKSIEQIKDLFKNDHGNPGPVHSVLLLTDGLANQGITVVDTLVEALATSLKTGPPTKVHTFGYGGDHNGALLKRLAEATDGNYYFIQKEDDVPTTFADALGGLLSVIVQNATVNVTATPGVTIEKIFTGLKNEQKEDGSHTVQSADLYSEERKDIMIRLKIPSLCAPTDVYPVLSMCLSYFDVQAAETVTVESVVSVKRPGEVPEGQVVDSDFLDQKLRITVAEQLMNAAQLADNGQADAALLCVDECASLASTELHQRGTPLSGQISAEVNRARATFGDKKREAHGSNSLWGATRSLDAQRSSCHRTSVQRQYVARALNETVLDPPRNQSSESTTVPQQGEEVPQTRPNLLKRMFSGSKK